MEKKRIDEVIGVRAVACMCVVMVHTLLTFITLQNISSDSSLYALLDTVRVLIVFGTPTFVFISALVVSYSYQKELPNGFYIKRIKFILLPYLAMAVLYALLAKYNNLTELPERILFNAFGGYHGWFVLVVFQFYFLQQFFLRNVEKWKPLIVLIISLIINAIYLGFFNFSEPIKNTPFLNYVWDKGYWLLFPGWVFYFSLAFYAGRNYVRFIRLVNKYKNAIILMLVVFAGVVVTINSLDIIESGSKRVDMIFYASTVILIMFILFSKVKTIPEVLKIISDYSFGIYLLHMFWLTIIYKVLQIANMGLGFLSIIVLFVGSIVSSMVTIYVLNSISIGKYLVGRVTIHKKH